MAGKLGIKLGGVRVGEATPVRIDAALRSMSNTHGPVMARQAKTILSGGLQLAVMANVLGANPVREVQPIKSKRPPKGAPALTADQLRDSSARPNTAASMTSSTPSRCSLRPGCVGASYWGCAGVTSMRRRGPLR